MKMTWNRADALATGVHNRFSGYLGTLAYVERYPADNAAHKDLKWRKQLLRDALEAALRALDATE